MMKNHIRFFVLSLTLYVLIGNARTHPAPNALSIQRLPSQAKNEARALIAKLSPVVAGYAQKNSLVSPGYPYESYNKHNDWLVYSRHFLDFDLSGTKFQTAQTLYALKIDGKDYIAGVGSFVSMLKAEPHCIPTEKGATQGHCELIAEHHETCHLFLFEPHNYSIQAVGAMPIERDNRPMPGGKERGWWNYNPRYPNDPRQIEGWPRCDGVLAVAPAKVVPNALLITLTYIDSGAPVTKHEDEYPPQFKTTSLLRFSTDKQGKLQITQDNTCLGNPNTYSSIVAARKALTACQMRRASTSP